MPATVSGMRGSTHSPSLQPGQLCIPRHESEHARSPRGTPTPRAQSLAPPRSCACARLRINQVASGLPSGGERTDNLPPDSFLWNTLRLGPRSADGTIVFLLLYAAFLLALNIQTDSAMRCSLCAHALFAFEQRVSWRSCAAFPMCDNKKVT